MQKSQTDSTIVLLLTLAIVFSIGGVVLNYVLLSSVDVPVLSVTGRVTDSSSTVTLTQSGTAGITLTDAAIAFGSGYYNASCSTGKSDLQSNRSYVSNSDAGASPTCWINTTSFLPLIDAHTIQNNGSVKVNVSAYSNQYDAEAFFCGAGQPNGCPLTNNAAVSILAQNNEANSCPGTDLVMGFLAPASSLLTSNVNGNATMNVCRNLDYQDASDSVDVYYNFVVPKDATAGAKTLTVTYQALAI